MGQESRSGKRMRERKRVSAFRRSENYFIRGERSYLNFVYRFSYVKLSV